MSSAVVKGLKTAARNSDNVTMTYKALSNVSANVTDLASVLRKMDIGSYAKTFGKTVPSLKGSSKLVDTGKAVASFAAAVPPSTDNLLKSLDPSILKNSVEQLSNVADATKKFSSSNLANLRSLKKLDNVSVAITKTAKVDGVSGLVRRSEKLLSNADKYKTLSRVTPQIKRVDDVGDALKKSKGVATKIDDAVEAGAKITKKSSKKIDDLGDAAKKLSKSKKALNFAKKWNGVVNVVVMSGFYLGMYISNKMNDEKNSDSSSLYDSLVSDPASDAFPITRYDENDLIVAVDEGEITLLETVQRKEILFAIVAAMVIVATL